MRSLEGMGGTGKSVPEDAEALAGVTMKGGTGRGETIVKRDLRGTRIDAEIGAPTTVETHRGVMSEHIDAGEAQAPVAWAREINSREPVIARTNDILPGHKARIIDDDELRWEGHSCH